MSGTMPDRPSGANPLGELAKFALAATERNMTLARNWSDAVLATLKEQADDARANLTTLTATLEAMERTLTSQEETNRALRQSLEGYRQLVEGYAAAQERTARLVQSSVDDLKSAGQGQMEAARALLPPVRPAMIEVRAKWVPRERPQRLKARPATRPSRTVQTLPVLGAGKAPRPSRKRRRNPRPSAATGPRAKAKSDCLPGEGRACRGCLSLNASLGLMSHG